MHKYYLKICKTENVLTNIFFAEILAKAEWLTVDPYMRLRSKAGEQMPGGQIAR